MNQDSETEYKGMGGEAAQCQRHECFRSGKEYHGNGQGEQYIYICSDSTMIKIGFLVFTFKVVIT